MRTDGELETLGGLRRSLFWVSAPIFFINFALPVKSKELGASAFEVGGLFSLFTLSLLIFRPIIGVALDRYGRRRFFLVSLVLYAIAYAGYGLAGDINMMYAARLLQGLGAALLLLSVDAITADLTNEDDRASAMGKNLESQARSTFLGATIGFGLIGALPLLGWSISFAAFTIFALFAFWSAYRSVPESAHRVVATAKNERPQAFTRLLIWLVPLGFASALIMPIYLVYLQDVFTPDKRLLSLAFFPAGLVFAILPSKLGALVDRLGSIKLSAVAMISLIVLYLLMPLWPNFWMVVVLYTFSSIAWAVLEPARKALTARLSGGQVAQGFGLAEMAFGIGAVLGPLAGGYIYDSWDKAFAFYLNAGAMLVALGIMLALLRNIEADSTRNQDDH